jgi:cell division protein FtsB
MAKKAVVFFKFFAITLLLLLLFMKPFFTLRELKMKNKILTEEIDHLKRHNAALEEEKKKLEEDIDYVEKRAREKMGIVKEGEIIYKIAPSEE